MYYLKISIVIKKMTENTISIRQLRAIVHGRIPLRHFQTLLEFLRNDDVPIWGETRQNI